MKLTEIKGSVLDCGLPVKGWHVLAHVVNNVGAFGAGVAGQMAQRWPETKKQYFEWRRSSTFQLGAVEFQLLQSGLVIAHLLAQNGLPAHDNPRPLDYAALKQCLQKLGLRCRELENCVLHIPRLGCGYAGGNWTAVKILLSHELPKNLDVRVYQNNWLAGQ